MRRGSSGIALATAAGLLLALSCPARAVNSRAGTSGAQFLKIGAGSRAGAMADAYSALTDDAYALYYNPGALVRLSEPQLAAAHTSYFAGSNYEVVGFVYPLRGSSDGEASGHVLGASIYNLSVSDIERRTTDTPGNLGTFSAGDYSYNLSYAYRLGRELGLGVTGKAIHSSIDSYDATAFALDLGAHYTPRPDAARPVSLAAVVKNAGTRQKFAGNSSDPLPLGLTLGAGLPIFPRKLRAELDLTKYRDSDPFVSLGGEYSRAFSDSISGAFRAGYSSHYRDNSGLAGMTLGLGLGFHRASFDFAWIPFGDLGDTFRYSLLVRFGGSRPPASP